MQKYLRIILIIFVITSLCSASTFAQKPKAVWQSYIKQSRKLTAKRQFDESLKLVFIALDSVNAKYGDSSKYVATVLGEIAKVYYYKGEYNISIDYYERQRDVAKISSKGQSLKYAQSLNNLSVLYQTVGRDAEVESLLLESAKIKKKIGGGKDSAYAKTLNNLGQYYYSRGNYPEATGYFENSLKIKENILGKDNPSVATTKVNIGLLSVATGNNEKALKYFEQASKSLKKSLGETHPDAISSDFHLASLLISMGEIKKAEKYLDRLSLNAEALMSTLTEQNINSLFGLAKLQIKLDKNENAKELLKNLLPAAKSKIGNSHPTYGKILKALGITLWISGDLESAYLYLEESVFLTQQIFGTNNINYANVVHNFAGLLKDMQEFEQADENYKEAFDIYLYIIENYFPYYSEADKTKFYQHLKEKFDMFNCYVLSRQFDNPELIGQMYDLHIATKGILLDYSKNLFSAIENSGNTKLINKYKTWLAKKEQLAKLYDESPHRLAQIGINIEDIETETSKLEKEIQIEAKKLGEGGDKIKSSWKDIQKTLAEGEAAIEIIRFRYFGKGWQDSTIYSALLITPETKNNPELIQLEDGRKLDGKFLNRRKKNVKAKFPDKRSYTAYWERIDEYLEGINKINLSSDGVYNIVNPAGFLRPDGTYVADSQLIININNTKELLQKQQYSTSKSAKLFGFPDYDVSGGGEITDESLEKIKKNEIKVAPLPGTKKEVNILNDLLSTAGWSANPYMKSEASETKFKSTENASILHIATHGYFMGDLDDSDQERVFGVDKEKAIQNPLLRSGLLFSGATNSLNFDFSSEQSDENGILTAFEVSNMDLRGTDLVIMSACETGLGKIMNGEGVYGLQRAFQVAGAKSVIMSLWTVNDQTTQELMVSFYSKYLAGEDVATAFNNARLEIKEKYPMPYYWAAFKLLGGQ
jgi:uncharacterized protein YjiS (DUF1127 family)